MVAAIDSHGEESLFGSLFVPNPGNSLTLFGIGFGFGGVENDTCFTAVNKKSGLEIYDNVKHVAISWN